MSLRPLFWTLLFPLLGCAALPLFAYWGWVTGLAFPLFIGLLAAIGCAWWLVRRLGGEITAMRRGMEVLGQGAARMPVPDTKELAQLAQTFNTAMEALEARWEADTRHRQVLEMIFSHMQEAVVLLDAGERIVDLNPAAAKLFAIELHSARNRYLVERVPHAALMRHVSRVLKHDDTRAEQLTIGSAEQQRVLSVQGTPLRDVQGQNSGALLVFHDLTHLHRLEGMRSDFVANVSHELKSPLTAIQGFVETLQDGALEHPQKARHFLKIIARQSRRLMAIVEDLLHLSRIEQEEWRGEIALMQMPLKQVLQAAVQDCETLAQGKALKVELVCNGELGAAINAPLLEQALVNLLGNAIKYSPQNGRVRLSAAVEEGGVAIRVQDWGKGIAAPHLPRLFERFYRVDAARSRELGGTGLGLAIVKHIAQAHGGRVGVVSSPGEGSSFAIYLPG